MKVGLSYSRCLLDIYNNVVPIEEVLVIIARTDFNPEREDHWQSIWKGYTKYNAWSNVEWEGYEEKEGEFKAITVSLYRSGRLHQPRQFGARVSRSSSIWLEVQ